MNKIYKIALALLLVLSGITGISTNVDAATAGSADVTLHKVKVGKDKVDTPNTGIEMPDFKGEPLKGAEFTVYDVTEDYHELISKDTDKVNAQENAIKAIAADSNNYKDDVKKLKTVTTDDKGIAKFEDLPLKKGSVDAVYLFLETLSPAGESIVEIAPPMVIGMPIYNGDKINTDIHLYPKNVFVKDEKVLSSIDDVPVYSNEELVTVSTGNIIGYKVNAHVPADIKEHKSFALIDTPSNGLRFVNPDNLEVKVGKEILKLNTDYSVMANLNGGFKLTFAIDNPATVSAIAGKQITISYEMKLTASVNPDEIASNSAEIKVGDKLQPKLETVVKPNPETPEIPEIPGDLKTGGKKFQKEDSHTGLGLAGAEFHVSQDGKFAEFDLVNGEYVFSKWVDVESAKTKITSLADGSLIVKGLKDGSYKLTETKTPSDKYVQLKDPVDFEVKHGTFGTITLPVLNIPKGLLPSTGGSGIYGYLLVGGFLVISAYVWNKRSNKLA